MLLGEGFADGALCELGGNVFLGNGCSNGSSAGSSSHLDDLLGQLQSPDGNDLPLDALTIDKDSLIVKDIDNGGQLALKRSVVDRSNAADFNEFVIGLNRVGLTM